MKIAALLKPVAVQEDWGSSDWYPIMKSMKKYVDEKFDGKQTDENLKAAALQAVPFYMEDMGYDDEEDAADAAVRTFKARRKFPESGLAESRLAEARQGSKYDHLSARELADKMEAITDRLEKERKAKKSTQLAHDDELNDMKYAMQRKMKEKDPEGPFDYKVWKSSGKPTSKAKVAANKAWQAKLAAEKTKE